MENKDHVNENFSIRKSCMISGELGLFANREFKKDDFLGTYHGELCTTTELIGILKSKSKYEKFIKKYKITSKLSRKQTCVDIQRFGFNLDDKNVVIMPKYPVSDYTDFYFKYNPMLYVNEPPQNEYVYNPYLQDIQDCKINVLAFTNYENKRIDYVCCDTVYPNQEFVVYYGNQYDRSEYNINYDGCNKGPNKIFFT